MSRIVAALTVAAYLVLVARVASAADALPALGIGLAYTLVAIFGFAWVRDRGLPWRLAFLAVQVPLATELFDLANATVGATLLVMVLVIECVLALPLPITVAVVAATPLLHLGMPGDDMWREGVGTLAASLFAAVVTWLLVREQTTREQLQVANARLAELAAQAEQLATTRERNRVARDIHDGLGHHLTVIGMQIQAARAVGATDPGKADEVLGKAQRQATEALDEVRRSVRVLREPRQWDSLVDAVRELVETAAALGPAAGLVVEGEPHPLEDGVEETVYRVVQEGLTNVRKHAAATSVEVLLDYRTPGAVTLTVTDDGRGTAAAADPGFGLVGLRERLERLEGSLSFTSRPGNGATLRAEVPAS